MEKETEFVAHASTILCASLGRRSASVLATGGDEGDSRVNLWRVGRPSSLLSLAVGKNGVACVSFDGRDEVVGAGSVGGVLRLIDLVGGKVRSRLKGHRAACTSVDFHPYGDFVVSGSADSNVKVWDVRRQACIRTYKGHGDALSGVKFSPDGKWVVSTATDGRVKLWDLTAGKLMHEFTSHRGPVLSMAFHPKEFLLATGSADRTCRFWDVDALEHVGTCPGENASIEKVAFDPSGKHLVSCTKDTVKLWTWEPSRCQGSCGSPWSGKLASVAFSSSGGSMVACSFWESFVQVHSIELKALQERRVSKSASSARPRVQPQRRSRPKSSSQNCGGAGISLMHEIDSSSPPRNAIPDGNNIPRSPTVKKSPPATKAQVRRLSPKRDSPSPIRSDDASSKQHLHSPGSVVESKVQRKSRGVQLYVEQPSKCADDSSAAASPTPLEAYKESKRPSPKNKIIPRSRRGPLDLSFSKFRGRNIGLGASTASGGIDEESILARRGADSSNVRASSRRCRVISNLLEGHSGFAKIMLERQRELEFVDKVWSRGDISSVVAHVCKVRDDFVAVDVLRSRNLQRAGAFTLSTCAALLPRVSLLLRSEFEDHVETALSTCAMLFKSFSDVISSSLDYAKRCQIGRGQVDISREERVKRAKACFDGFKAFRETFDECVMGYDGISARVLGVAETLMRGLDSWMDNNGL